LSPSITKEETIAELYRRVSAIMNNLDGAVELILVNDGSKDSSLKLLRELHQADSRVCYISFARNFGHQAAVTAGLNFCRGQVIIVLDADLARIRPN
jgi:dolichol-phosphate mannosyltransferase